LLPAPPVRLGLNALAGAQVNFATNFADECLEQRQCLGTAEFSGDQDCDTATGWFAEVARHGRPFQGCQRSRTIAMARLR